MMEKSLYFAYGSNINLDQMSHRCPDAKPLGPVTLDNYELLFRGSPGGSGFATIAPCEGSQVQGLLWEITPRCERALDFYETRPLHPRITMPGSWTVCAKTGCRWSRWSRRTAVSWMSCGFTFPAMPSSTLLPARNIPGRSGNGWVTI